MEHTEMDGILELIKGDEEHFSKFDDDYDYDRVLPSY